MLPLAHNAWKLSTGNTRTPIYQGEYLEFTGTMPLASGSASLALMMCSPFKCAQNTDETRPNLPKVQSNRTTKYITKNGELPPLSKIVLLTNED